MPNFLPLNERQRELVNYWLPALAAGIVACIVFFAFGKTPFIRAFALAAPVSVIGLTLRRFGGLLAFTGALALAFSPAFWSQTGGGQPTTLTTIVAVLIVAGIAGAAFIWFGRRPGLGLTIGLVIFTILFWALVGTNRSLRLTTFFSAGLIFVLMNALFSANPRPDEPQQKPAQLRPYHTWGLILFLALGILNDPLFTLLAPATILGLVLCRSNLKPWHWVALFVILVIGLRGIAVEYVNSTWWVYPAAQAEAEGIRVPYMMTDGWRDGGRWVVLINLVISQFTFIGVILGVLGLSRFARWYPPLGVVTMIAYAAYALFGLVYFGKDSAVLLLPLLMIQTIWMTYAVFTFSQWLQKSLRSSGTLVRWAAPGAFVLMPLMLFLRITGAL